MCDKAVSEDPLMLKYCHDNYKTQIMYISYWFWSDRIKIVLDWLVTINMIEKLDSAVFSDDYNPEVINHVRLMVLYNKFKQSKKHRWSMASYKMVRPALARKWEKRITQTLLTRILKILFFYILPLWE